MRTKQERYAIKKAWAKRNPEKLKEYRKRDWVKHRDKRLYNHKIWVEKNREQVLQKNREWYLRVKNNPELKAQKRAWYLAHRDAISLANKEKRASRPKRVLKTKEEVLIKNKAWRSANRERLNAKQREWNHKNRERLSRYRKNYYSSRLSVASQFSRLLLSARRRHGSRIVTHKGNSTQKKYEVVITLQDFADIIAKPCHYCGEIEGRRGIDRIDNSKGYTRENSVPCCKNCNYMKKNLTKENFLSHVNKIYKHNEYN